MADRPTSAGTPHRSDDVQACIDAFETLIRAVMDYVEHLRQHHGYEGPLSYMAVDLLRGALFDSKKQDIIVFLHEEVRRRGEMTSELRKMVEFDAEYKSSGGFNKTDHVGWTADWFSTMTGKGRTENES